METLPDAHVMAIPLIKAASNCGVGFDVASAQCRNPEHTRIGLGSGEHGWFTSRSNHGRPALMHHVY